MLSFFFFFTSIDIMMLLICFGGFVGKTYSVMIGIALALSLFQLPDSPAYLMFAQIVLCLLT